MWRTSCGSLLADASSCREGHLQADGDHAASAKAVCTELALVFVRLIAGTPRPGSLSLTAMTTSQKPVIPENPGLLMLKEVTSKPGKPTFLVEHRGAGPRASASRKQRSTAELMPQ